MTVQSVEAQYGWLSVLTASASNVIHNTMHTMPYALDSVSHESSIVGIYWLCHMSQYNDRIVPIELCNCKCNHIRPMNYIVKTCLITKFDNALPRLHEAIYKKIFKKIYMMIYNEDNAISTWKLRQQLTALMKWNKSEVSNLVRKAAHDDTVASQFTHVSTAKFPHLSCYAVLFHQRLLKATNTESTFNSAVNRSKWREWQKCKIKSGISLAAGH